MNISQAPSVPTEHRPSAMPALVAAAAAGGLGACGLWMNPELELRVFSAGAARLGGLLSGSPVLQTDGGWLLPAAGVPVVVTNACSATDFFLIVATLVAWQFARRGRRAWSAVLIGLSIALPVTLCINAVRIVAVAQAHRWVIPRWPDDYGAFLHMLTGVAVFLPALIALNLILEFHGRTQHNTRA